jgi:hypothetical protein
VPQVHHQGVAYHIHLKMPSLRRAQLHDAMLCPHPDAAGSPQNIVQLQACNLNQLVSNSSSQKAVLSNWHPSHASLILSLMGSWHMCDLNPHSHSKPTGASGGRPLPARRGA